jgi:hypothetical protein
MSNIISHFCTSDWDHIFLAKYQICITIAQTVAMFTFGHTEYLDILEGSEYVVQMSTSMSIRCWT